MSGGRGLGYVLDWTDFTFNWTCRGLRFAHSHTCFLVSLEPWTDIGYGHRTLVIHHINISTHLSILHSRFTPCYLSLTLLPI
jgi:hypothetical protein